MTIFVAGSSIADFVPGTNFTGLTNETNAGRRGPYVSEGIVVSTPSNPIFIPLGSRSSFWFSFYFFTPDTVFNGDDTFYFVNNGSGVIRVNFSSDESIRFQYRTGASTYVTFATAVAAPNRLIRFDIEIVLDNTSGAFRVYADNSLLGSLTGDTILTSEAFSTVDSFEIYSLPSVTPFTISAIIGSTTDTRGMHLDQLSATGSGTNSGFSGTFADIDELGIPNDADFLSSVTLNATSTFATENHDAAFNTGFAVEALVVTTRAYGEAGNFLRPVVLSSGTLGEGTGLALDLARQPHQHIFSLNPNTGTAWNNTTINAAEIGVKLTNSA